MTSPPPPDPPLLTPNPEQIADPWREVVDPKKHKWIGLFEALTGVDRG